MDYIILTPAKNEGKYIEFTIQSIIAQTVKPKKWIIIDDGSMDETSIIVSKYVRENNFIELIKNNTQSETRSGGSKVVRAFNVGYESIRQSPFDIVVKMDADLTLPQNYFEEVIKCFKTYPNVGLCGGYCVVASGEVYIKESYSDDHVRGAFKSYRRECFNAIGGFKEIWNWDSIDEAAVRYHGWELRVLPLAVIHHRPTSKEYNLLRHCYKTGFEMYKERIDVISLLVIASAHLMNPPAIIGSILYLSGYFFSWIKRENKTINKELGDFIRNERYTMLLKKIGYRKYRS